MKTPLLLAQIKDALETLNGYQNPLPIGEYLVPSKEQNSLVVKESQDEAEVILCLREDLLHRLSKLKVPNDFSLNILPDLSVTIEELSHFNTFCENAMNNRSISPLELEVQAEVDKFGLSLEWLSQRNEDHLREKIFAALFDEFQLAPWVKSEDCQRYQDAHQIARNFCRRILDQNLPSLERQSAFQSFYRLPKDQKLSPKY